MAVKRTGTVIVTGGISKEVSVTVAGISKKIIIISTIVKEALTWKQSVKDYIDSNPVKGPNTFVVLSENITNQVISR